MKRLRSAAVLASMLALASAMPGIRLARMADAASAAQAGAGLLTGHHWTVTLMTGDVVGVRAVSGKPPLVTVRPGPGRRQVIFTKYVSTSGTITVLPHDVAALVGPVLDPTLFDVTALIRNGDDDAHRSSIPLIVQGEHGASGTAVAAALGPALRMGKSLASIDAVAVSVPKASAAQQGRALAEMASAAVHAGRVSPSVTKDVRHVWLDRSVRVNRSAGVLARLATAPGGPLDHNLLQIGAPTAWTAGDTGRGVTVAVLDTGVDSTHPDLTGQIVTAQNFTASPDTVDRFGHGTFVAAEIAGTGAAAGGERRGVAFGARLAVGKVLGDDGTGLASDVIAGMQWAATRARVINMSLGSDTPSDGTDPLSEAVNQLTAADHALFVIAAGNSGPADETVGSPAAADDALSVGAVDGQDRLAGFSSRGPRPGDNAIKPEIVAPGVDIVGARAAGTTMGSPLDARYTTASGTSMSTPEVAGAAAILAQLHPAWTPAQLRAALVSTAHPASGGDTYELGGGRLDIASAVSGHVVADEDTARLGTVSFSQAKAVTSQLSWTNTGPAAVAMVLSATLADHAGRPAPPGTLRLSAGQITVPPGGSAATTLSVNPERLATHPGLYEGAVTASYGRQSVHIPVSLYLPPATYPLTLRATPLPGTAAGGLSASAFVTDTTDPDLFQPTFVPLSPDGTATIQVPAGKYWIAGEVDDLTNAAAERSAMTGQPEVTVSGDTTVMLDGAAAVPVTATVAGHATHQAEASMHIERSFAGQIAADDVVAFGTGTASPVLFAQPTGTASTGTFQAYSTFRLASPAGNPAPYVYDLFHPLGNQIPRVLGYTVGPAQQATLARIEERFHAIDGNTASISETRYGMDSAGFLAVQNDSDVPGGSTRTDYVSAGSGIGWIQDVAPPFTVSGQDHFLAWAIVAPGIDYYTPGSSQTADWVRQPFRPGPYSATKPSISDCTPQPSTRSRGDIHVALTDLQDLPDGFDCLTGAEPWTADTTRTMRLYQDGNLVGTSHSPVADFTVPDAAADYRLTYDDDTSAAIPVSTQTRTTWTFRSAPPAGLGAIRIPLLLVGYDLPLNLASRPDGRTAVLTVATVAGTPPATGTSVRMWTSAGNGTTWQAASVRSLGGGRYAATLPDAAPGQAVSLRVQATDSAGSGIDQTIMTAYRA